MVIDTETLSSGMLVEQDLHVLDRVDRHAGLADVAGHARMVGVVAAVGRQVEGDRHALAAGGERLAVEGVGRFGGGEAGVLADGPRLDRVHGGLRAAQEGLEAGQRVGVLQAFGVGLGVQRLDREAFGRDPVQLVEVAPRRLLGGSLFPGLDVGLGIDGIVGFRHGKPREICGGLGYRRDPDW
jgi:hypothetical protein